MKSNTATATTATAKSSTYVGRFAPSPTGDLHLGSLLTAAASFLDARAHGGRWLLRMEDLDTPREVPGATTRILQCLDAYHLELGRAGHLSKSAPGTTMPLRCMSLRSNTVPSAAPARAGHCGLSRSTLASCRDAPPAAAGSTAIRFRLDPHQTVASRIAFRGSTSCDAQRQFGDFVIRRRDGLWAYMLAVVVDDADQGVTHVVRGADLLDSTAPQIQLQQALRIPSAGLCPRAGAHRARRWQAGQIAAQPGLNVLWISPDKLRRFWSCWEWTRPLGLRGAGPSECLELGHRPPGILQKLHGSGPLPLEAAILISTCLVTALRYS